jgi:hypothetical protein
VNFSRRDFLKLSGLTLAGTLLPPTPPEEAVRQVQSLGRACKTIYTYDQPSLSARPLTIIPGDTVLNLYATTTSNDEHYNRVWYETTGGYVYSGHIQPVRWEFQTPIPKPPAGGFLGEVTVPVTKSRTFPNPRAKVVYPLYYETTHWVSEALVDEEKVVWYRIFDDWTKNYTWVKGEHLRPVAPEELTPLAPDVADKRIEINLEKQTFQCFEADQLVLDTLCSTGTYRRTENGKRIYGTPSGRWAVNRKRPSRHMAGDDLAAADFYDLPGVPWVSYFHWWGVSIHGTYWHNDYGAPHSHGCINLPSATAKWVFRWSQPTAGLDRKLTEGPGTPVMVF